jgi:hypothetical protein
MFRRGALEASANARRLGRHRYGAAHPMVAANDQHVPGLLFVRRLRRGRSSAALLPRQRKQPGTAA